MSLPRVELGDGLRVPALGFGAMGLSHAYGPADRDESLATLHHAVDAGARLIDTADIYGAGANEELVAELLRDRRDEVVLATKFGFLTEPDADGLRVRGAPESVRPALERSLARLGVDRVELYYYHRVDPRVPIEETVGALAELVAAGMVGHIGLSEVTAGELERAAAVHPIAAVQSEWSIWSRDIEERVVPAARRVGAGVVAYSPLGRGFLAAPIVQIGTDDNRRHFPRFDPENLAANQAIGEVVREVAGELGVSPAQLALAWLAERGRRLDVPVVPIPGTRRAARIDENIGALELRLPPWAIERLAPLAAQVSGDRARDTRTISQGRERERTP